MPVFGFVSKLPPVLSVHKNKEMRCGAIFDFLFNMVQLWEWLNDVHASIKHLHLWGLKLYAYIEVSIYY